MGMGMTYKPFGWIASAMLSMVVSTDVRAEAVDINVVADLSDRMIYEFLPQNNIVMLHVPIADPPLAPYDAGDRLNVSVAFVSDQRLILTANPTGMSASFGDESIGVYVADTDLDHIVGGSSTFTADLIDPRGDFLISTLSRSNGFGGAQGAILRASDNWTDTSFSVAGFAFAIDLENLSQPVLPDTITLELREFTVPEPSALLLGIFGASPWWYRIRRAAR